jgi:Flagellar hook-length control protein FliK
MNVVLDTSAEARTSLTPRGGEESALHPEDGGAFEDAIRDVRTPETAESNTRPVAHVEGMNETVENTTTPESRTLSDDPAPGISPEVDLTSGDRELPPTHPRDDAALAPADLDATAAAHPDPSVPCNDGELPGADLLAALIRSGSTQMDETARMGVQDLEESLTDIGLVVDDVAPEIDRTLEERPTPMLSMGGEAPAGSVPAPDPESPPSPAPGREITDALATRIRILTDQGGGETRLDLSSQDLGRVDLAVEVEDGQPTVRVTPERTDVADLLLRHVPDLKEILTDLGLTVEDVTVEVAGRVGGRPSPLASEGPAWPSPGPGTRMPRVEEATPRPEAVLQDRHPASVPTATPGHAPEPVTAQPLDPLTMPRILGRQSVDAVDPQLVPGVDMGGGASALATVSAGRIRREDQALQTTVGAHGGDIAAAPVRSEAVGVPEAAPVRAPETAPLPSRATFEAVVKPIRILAVQGGGEVRLQLTQPDLGHVDVTIIVEDGHVTARLIPDRSDVGDLLMRHVPDLRDSLNDLGLTVDDVTVGLEQRREESTRSRGGTRPTRPGPGSLAGSDESPERRAESTYIGPRGVNVWA